jgi:1-deoxyxylulose-5-phosphate synthase
MCGHAPFYLLLLGVTAPIIGITSLNHLEEAVQALKLRLTSEEVKILEEPYVPRTVFGH